MLLVRTVALQVSSVSARQFLSTSAVLLNHNPLGLPPRPAAASLPPDVGANLPRSKRPVPHVSRLITVASAKGGVGKSTVAMNLAFTLQRALSTPSRSARVGLLDLDVFGPSVPRLLQLEDVEPPALTSEGKIVPHFSDGLSSMSMGYLLPRGSQGEEKPVVWRGLMLQKAVQQLLFDVDWRQEEKPLDVLVVDTPPGTGDVQLSFGQSTKIDGAVLITTPQPLALLDTERGLHAFRTLSIPILGLIINQSYYTCPSCGGKHRIFGGPEAAMDMAARTGIKVLGEVPLLSLAGGQEATRVWAEVGHSVWEEMGAAR